MLHHRQTLPDYIKLFQSMYQNASATLEHDGASRILIHLLSGVLQGCPASAFLFNNAIDPFLASFDNILRKKHAGIVRACADDKGIVLQQLRHLSLIYPTYSDCKTHAGLALKPPKCVLVPLCGLSEEVHAKILSCNLHHIPQWQ